jgi:superfamily II DNA/RNA helicase
MYDEYAKQLIDLIPDMLDLDRTECRRALSKAYFYIVQSKIGITTNEEGEAAVEVKTIRDILRRMVDTLESISVFDHINGLTNSEDVENACAFVAAEALSLLGNISIHNDVFDFDIISDNFFYTSIESALLYMIGGYDIDALSIVKDISISDNQIDDLDVKSNDLSIKALFLADRLILLCRGQVNSERRKIILPVQKKININNNYDNLLNDIRANFYFQIGKSIDFYLDWLGGYDEKGNDLAISSLNSIKNISSSTNSQNFLEFSDIYHLSSLLIATIERTNKRSLIHFVPIPKSRDTNYSSQFRDYLLFRARGDDKHIGRPFLWPSSIEYVNNCLPGPHTDAVISMPTGSGKSFIGELAITHALSTGWVLYLAPTNALAHQIRYDLDHSLSSFEQISIRAFVGSEEYTTLLEEQISLPENNFVAVMTPEKCSLALRLYPDQFENCSLCIFDECHLINDQNRGITADVLIAQLALHKPSIKYLLMSAMVSNPEELAEWLNSIHQHTTQAKPLAVKWRPSRTLRSLLVVDKDPYYDNLNKAKQLLFSRPEKRVNEYFVAPLALIAGLSGPWTTDGAMDYRIAQLPVSFRAKISRSDEIVFDSWKNTSSRFLAEMFAKSGIPTLCFILTSRHHTFSNAEKVISEIPNQLVQSEELPEIIESWLSISDAELGIDSALRKLLKKGIAVHSSAMLPTEQLASEWMFSHKKIQLMFATGTLAQGLNLPAIAVVIAGTSMGDPRDQNLEKNFGINRVNALILNGFGRAGRPGFSNQGIAVLVSDNPYVAKNTTALNPVNALNEYSVLGESDAAVKVQSPIEGFIDNIFTNNIMNNEVTIEELTLTSLLAEYDSDNINSGQILYNTFGGFKKREIFTKPMIEQVRKTINEIKVEYLMQTDGPDWINAIAMKSGVDYFHALRIWQAYNLLDIAAHDEPSKLDVIDWANLFFDVMAQQPPNQIIHILPDVSIKRDTALTRMRRLIVDNEYENSIPWKMPSEWLGLWDELKKIIILYMDGSSYIDLARNIVQNDNFEITNKRTEGDDPIPMVFGFISKVIDNLSIDAGCFVAIMEREFSQNKKEAIPETLQALPLCIRNGCGSLGSLSWYRFGYRERVCAHALEASFPVPKDLSDDTERSIWVHRTRIEWLAGKLNRETHPLLPYIKNVLFEADK